jgi:hypothetical protein
MLTTVVFHSLSDISHSECPSLVAAFLSPRIAHVQAFGPTIRDFVIGIGDQQHYSKTFVGLCEGSTLTGMSSNRTFIQSVCYGLWNREIFEMVIGNSENQNGLDNNSDFPFIVGHLDCSSPQFRVGDFFLCITFLSNRCFTVLESDF